MTEFLYVDYQHDKPQNRAVRKQKLAFVQRAAQRKRRLAAVERLKASTCVFRQRLPLSYEPVAHSSGSVKGDEPGESGRSRQDGSESGGADLQQLKQIISATNFGSSPKTLLGQGFIDPFSTSPFPMTDFMNSYFHQLRNFTIPNAYPLDKSRMSVWWWQQGISQPVILLALLVSGAAHQTAMHAVHNNVSKYSQQSVREFLRLQGNMINTLNGILQNPDTAQSAVLIVASLRAIEAIEGNVEAAAAHTKGLEVLIQLNGGLESLDHMTLSKIYHGDILRAALTNAPLTLPLATTWRDEIIQEMKVIHSTTNFVPHLSQRDQNDSRRLSVLGQSFLLAPWYEGLEASMMHLLLISQRLIQYYEVARLQPSLVMPTDNDLFVVLGYQLISTQYNNKPIPSSSSTSCPPVSSLLNEPLRITLFIYLNIRVWNFQVFPIMKSMVKPLRQSLLFSTPTTAIPILPRIKQSAPDVLFWILFIGGMASQGHDEHAWFVAQLAEVSFYLGIYDWDTARDILGGFFYTEQPGQPGGEELWEQVVSARANSI